MKLKYSVLFFSFIFFSNAFLGASLAKDEMLPIAAHQSELFLYWVQELPHNRGETKIRALPELYPDLADEIRRKKALLPSQPTFRWAEDSYSGVINLYLFNYPDEAKKEVFSDMLDMVKNVFTGQDMPIPILKYGKDYSHTDIKGINIIVYPGQGPPNLGGKRPSENIKFIPVYNFSHLGPRKIEYYANDQGDALKVECVLSRYLVQTEACLKFIKELK